MAQRREMLEGLLAKKPQDVRPNMCSDRGWQYQHASCAGTESRGSVRRQLKRAQAARVPTRAPAARRRQDRLSRWRRAAPRGN